MDEVLKMKIMPEVGRLLGEIVDRIDSDRYSSETQELNCDLAQEFFDHSLDIAKTLEEVFPNGELFAIVDVEAHPEFVSVSVSYPPRFEAMKNGELWTVDAQHNDGWFFEAGDEKSARDLAKFYNTSPNARDLSRIRPDIKVHVSSLVSQLCLLRDNGVDVVAYEHKGPGVFGRKTLTI